MEDVCNSFIKNNNEAIKMYDEYLIEWISNNFIYINPYSLLINIPQDEKKLYNVSYLLSKYIIELNLHNRTYTNQSEKNKFFIELSEAILNDIRSYLLNLDNNSVNTILSYYYSISSYNRELSLEFVSFQKNREYNNTNNLVLNLLYTIMNDDVFLHSNTDQSTTEIEQFIATESDSIELLIKIICSENYSTKKTINFTNEVSKKLLNLSHLLVLLTNTRLNLTKGINKNEVIKVDSEGEITANNEYNYNNVMVSNYDYKFNKDWSEYDETLTMELNSEVFNKYGFDLYDMTKIKDLLVFDKDVMIGDKKVYLKMLMDIGIEKNRAENLFNYFSLNKNKERIVVEKLYKYLDSKYYDMSFKKIFINCNDKHYIVYKFLAKYASMHFIGSVFNSPNKFIKNEKVAKKITDSFCKSIEKLLKGAFPKCVIITNYYCSNDREIDVVFILQNKIYIIECKRLAFPETNNSIENMYKNITKNYINQLDMELEAFNKNKNKMLNGFVEDKLIDEKSVGDYEVKGLIVTKEFSLAHNLKFKYPILIKDKLIKYIKNDNC